MQLRTRNGARIVCACLKGYFTSVIGKKEQGMLNKTVQWEDVVSCGGRGGIQIQSGILKLLPC